MTEDFKHAGHAGLSSLPVNSKLSAKDLIEIEKVLLLNHALVDALYAAGAKSGNLKNTLEALRALNENSDPTLWSLIKTKSSGYFRWMAFAMVLTPIAFFIFGHK
jgi:hypothetical protein